MIELNTFLGYTPGKPGTKAVIMLCYQVCWTKLNIKHELYITRGSYDDIYQILHMNIVLLVTLENFHFYALCLENQA